MKRIVAVLVSLTMFPLVATAQSVTPFRLPSARMAALGGPHAASVNGVDSIFENPAGFASDDSELSIASLVVNPSGPVFDIAGLLLGGNDLTTGLVSLLDATGRLYVSAHSLGPLSFAYSGKGLGFGIFNTTNVIVNAASLLSVSYSISEDILLTGGYAYRFNIADRQSLDLGIMPKGFIRASVGKRASLTDIMALADDPGAILGSPLTMTTGLGIDVGFRWSYDDMLAIGLVARDAYSPAMVTSYAGYQAFIDSPSTGVTTNALVPADLSLGLAYSPRSLLLSTMGARVLVLLDYTNILDLFVVLPRNPILNVGLGIELTLLDILSLRAGIKDALPTAGLGIDLSFCTFSLAMYGKELGMEPGSRPVYNLLVSFEFRY
ncbi:hypothetical protein MASR2M48_14430 [Spirochaetota bacterium]